MYQVTIEVLAPKEGNDSNIILPKENTIYDALKPIQENGLVVNGRMIVERRLVNVERVAKILTFQLLTATGILVAHAYLTEVDPDKDTYDQFCDQFETEIMEELEESGATRELDFDLERELRKRYESYLNS